MYIHTYIFIYQYQDRKEERKKEMQCRLDWPAEEDDGDVDGWWGWAGTIGRCCCCCCNSKEAMHLFRLSPSSSESLFSFFFSFLGPKHGQQKPIFSFSVSFFLHAKSIFNFNRKKEKKKDTVYLCNFFFFLENLLTKKEKKKKEKKENCFQCGGSVGTHTKHQLMKKWISTRNFSTNKQTN